MCVTWRESVKAFLIGLVWKESMFHEMLRNHLYIRL